MGCRSGPMQDTILADKRCPPQSRWQTDNDPGTRPVQLGPDVSWRKIRVLVFNVGWCADCIFSSASNCEFCCAVCGVASWPTAEGAVQSFEVEARWYEWNGGWREPAWGPVQCLQFRQRLVGQAGERANFGPVNGRERRRCRRRLDFLHCE